MLRRHVERRPHHRICRSGVCVGHQFSKAEIDDSDTLELGVVIGRDHQNIFRLEIAMDDPLSMRRSCAGTDHPHQPPRTLDGKVVFALQEIAERRAFDELHDNEGRNLAITCLAEIINSNDVWMM